MASSPQIREDPALVSTPAASLVVVAERDPGIGTAPYASPVPNWSLRIPALDGLRGIAILLVLMRHSIFGMETHSKWLSVLLAAGQLSWSGVDLFFVLSGFLIGGILLDARNSPNYFKTFYIRRAYRIFPLYFAVTALFLFRHLSFHIFPGSLGDHSPLLIPAAAYLTLTQNVWMASLGWFGPTAMQATWSLAVEEQFYLTAPLLIRKIRPRRMVAALISVIVTAPLLRMLLHYKFTHGNFACYVLMPCRADALCLGVLAALLVRNPKFWQQLCAKRALLWWSTGIFLVGIAWMTYKGYDPFSSPMNTVGYSWIALFYTGCLLLAVSTARGWSHRLLCGPGLKGLGAIAYCSYLIHMPLILAGRRVLQSLAHAWPTSTWLVGGLLGVAATLVIASLSWEYFEKPLLRRGHRYTY